jgi:hypothetical protein
MRNAHIVLAAVSVLMIGFAGTSHAAAPNSPPASSDTTTNAGNGDTTSGSAPPAIRRPQQQQRPFYCFGDAACEREMARLGRPVADPGGNKRQDQNDGPYINGIPGQGYGPGFGNTLVPVVPGK